MSPLYFNLKVYKVPATFFSRFGLLYNISAKSSLIKNIFYTYIVSASFLLPWHPNVQHIFSFAGTRQVWKLVGKEPKYSQRHLLALLLVTYFTDVYPHLLFILRMFTPTCYLFYECLPPPVIYFTNVYLVVDAVLFEVEDLHVPHINLKARVQAQEKGQKS